MGRCIAYAKMKLSISLMLGFDQGRWNDYLGLYESTVQLLGDVSPPVDFKSTIIANIPYPSLSHYLEFMRPSKPSSPTDPWGQFSHCSSEAGRMIFGYERSFANFINDAYLKLGLNASTLLYITAGFRSEKFLRLFVSHGGDVNLMSPNGFGILAATIYAEYRSQSSNEVSPFCSSSRVDILPITRMLLQEFRAGPSSKGCCITPLQLTVLLSSKDPAIYLEIARRTSRMRSRP